MTRDIGVIVVTVVLVACAAPGTGLLEDTDVATGAQTADGSETE